MICPGRPIQIKSHRISVTSQQRVFPCWRQSAAVDVGCPCLDSASWQRKRKQTELIGAAVLPAHSISGAWHTPSLTKEREQLDNCRDSKDHTPEVIQKSNAPLTSVYNMVIQLWTRLVRLSHATARLRCKESRLVLPLPSSPDASATRRMISF